MKYTRTIKKEYMYLIIILLLGLILSSFIKPYMEGFKEGADNEGANTTQTTQSVSCLDKWSYFNGKCYIGKCGDNQKFDPSKLNTDTMKGGCVNRTGNIYDVSDKTLSRSLTKYDVECSQGVCRYTP